MFRPLALHLCLGAMLLCCERPESAPPAPVGSALASAGERRRVTSPCTGSAPADRLRLRPDRRFVGAVADLHHLVTGREREGVLCTLTEGGAHLRYQGEDVGTLPELPDFPDALRLLSDLAARLARRHAPALMAARATGGRGARRGVVGDKEILGEHEAWSELLAAQHRLARAGLDAGLIRSAAHALTSLSFLLVDPLGRADDIGQRALALLALLRGSGQAEVWDEALLAHSMGYGQAAAHLSSELPKSSALRAFLSGNDARLAELAEEGESPPGRRLLYLRLLLAREEREMAELLVTDQIRQPGFRLAAHGLLLHGSPAAPAERWRRSSLVLSTVALELGPGAGGTVGADRTVPASIPDLVERAEGALLSRRFHEAGPLLDARMHERYYLAHIHSALHALGLSLLEGASSMKEARKLAQDLAAARSHAGLEFARWYGLLLDSYEPGERTDALFHRLGTLLYSMPDAGAMPFLRIHSGLRTRLTAPLRETALIHLLLRLDTRPGDRHRFGHLAVSEIADHERADRIFQSLLGQTVHEDPDHLIWFLEVKRQDKALRALMRQEQMSPRARGLAILALVRLGQLTEGQAEREFQRLLRGFPDILELRLLYADHLRRTGRQAAAARLIGAWLELHEGEEGPDVVLMRAALRGTLSDDSRPEAGALAREGRAGISAAPPAAPGRPRADQAAAAPPSLDRPPPRCL